MGKEGLISVYTYKYQFLITEGRFLCRLTVGWALELTNQHTTAAPRVSEGLLIT